MFDFSPRALLFDSDCQYRVPQLPPCRVGSPRAASVGVGLPGSCWGDGHGRTARVPWRLAAPLPPPRVRLAVCDPHLPCPGYLPGLSGSSKGSALPGGPEASPPCTFRSSPAQKGRRLEGRSRIFWRGENRGRKGEKGTREGDVVSCTQDSSWKADPSSVGGQVREIGAGKGQQEKGLARGGGVLLVRPEQW